MALSVPSFGACSIFLDHLRNFLVYKFSIIWDAIGTFAPPPLGTAAALSADIASMFKRHNVRTSFTVHPADDLVPDS